MIFASKICWRKEVLNYLAKPADDQSEHLYIQLRWKTMWDRAIAVWKISCLFSSAKSKISILYGNVNQPSSLLEFEPFVPTYRWNSKTAAGKKNRENYPDDIFLRSKVLILKTVPLFWFKADRFLLVSKHRVGQSIVHPEEALKWPPERIFVGNTQEKREKHLAVWHRRLSIYSSVKSSEWSTKSSWKYSI